uniref:Uncharacterized protein n=1 Tax=Timema bartmani TaxID=61472 RepID=A0A7R9F2D5_9NEOP|nr:unnamed protein product [Timema bartmani]
MEARISDGCIKANQLCWKNEKVCIANDKYITKINKPGKELLPATQITGLVLARGGSKMIPRKNLAKIGNQTLLEMSLQVMNNFGKFASVWVSTDDDEIAAVAQRSGASVHRRSAETATDTAPSIVGVQEFCVNHPVVHTKLSLISFQTHCFAESLEALRIEPRNLNL